MAQVCPAPPIFGPSTLQKSETAIWDKVCHYQKQMKYFTELKKHLSELETLVNEMIEARLEYMSSLV